VAVLYHDFPYFFCIAAISSFVFEIFAFAAVVHGSKESATIKNKYFIVCPRSLVAYNIQPQMPHSKSSLLIRQKQARFVGNSTEAAAVDRYSNKRSRVAVDFKSNAVHVSPLQCRPALQVLSVLLMPKCSAAHQTILTASESSM
jgi:hypothetical protein